jgi:hypothetical protein
MQSPVKVLVLAVPERHASNAVIDNQDQDGSCRSHEHAIEIQAGNATSTEKAEQISAQNSANDSQHDIQKYAFAVPVDNLAPKKPGYQTEKNPTYNRHVHPFEVRNKEHKMLFVSPSTRNLLNSYFSFLRG